MEEIKKDFLVGLQDENADFKRLLTYVESCGKQMLSNREAARHVGYSEQYFCRWFRVHAHMSFQEYLRRRRMEYACELLKQGMSVAEVSAAVGYAKPASFIQCFRSYRKQTPYRYVRSLRDTEEQEKNT